MDLRIIVSQHVIFHAFASGIRTYNWYQVGLDDPLICVKR